ncbi:alpha/beta fold hydrolase [bacterium]|nr:alpha/beta fold hydrolase [candidate division CSSED10-310 bacterium]
MRSRIENHFLYFPDRYPQYWVEPSVYGLPFEDLWLDTPDGCRIHGWWIPSNRSDFAMMFCHGNGGHLAYRTEMIHFWMHRLQKPPSILIFDYRGYGRSGGRPAESNLYSDAVLFLKHLTTTLRFSMDRIVILGRSLGSAVAVRTALEYPPAGLILECPFRSVHAMSLQVFKLFQIPKWLINQKFDTESKIGGLKCPILIVHGGRDFLVPIRHGRKLFNLAPEPKTFCEIPSGHHDDIFLQGGPPYIDAYDTFLAHLDSAGRA